MRFNTDILQDQINWSRETFGPGQRTVGVVEHIRKELDEIIAQPTDLTEWVDVMILAFDGAWRAGYTVEQILETYVNKLHKKF